MKYIGNKTRLLNFIEQSLLNEDIQLAGVFCDLFAGTGSVGHHFKRRNMQVLSNDLMTYSYILNRTIVGLNRTPRFSALKEVLGLPPSASIQQLLDAISRFGGTRGYFYENFAPSGSFSRQFFTDENASVIDEIRDALVSWSDLGAINQAEYDYLLSSLINATDHVANMSGTYGAYLKIWRSVALKRIRLLPLDLHDNNQQNFIFQEKAEELISSLYGDVLYLDPPYNSRQYASNFHVLESLAVWDKQILKGVAGLRDYENQKSVFSSKKLASLSLKHIVEQSNFRYIVLSYNNEGIVPREEIMEMLSTRGKVREYVTDYRRFRTDRDHEKRQYKKVDDRVTEHLWIALT